MLKLTGINKTFFPSTVNERQALRNVDLQLEPGDFLTIIGSNGAGKSTLLNIVSGYLMPETGTVQLRGKDITNQKDHQRARYTGRVFQDPMAGTAPDLTIEENLALALLRGKRRGLSMGVTAARRQRFRTDLQALELGLEHRLKTKVGLLSGGQRQALSLLMASFTQPDVLLLDEHTAALDPQRAELVTNLTRDLVAKDQLTTIMVTHNMAQALELGNRLLMMHEGEIIFQVSGEAKARLTTADLLAEFQQIKGATISDQTMLQ